MQGCCFVLLVAALETIAPSLCATVDPWSAPKANPRQPNTWNFAARETSGYVYGVGKDRLVLYWPARMIQKMKNDPITGALLSTQETVDHFGIPPKSFILCDVLKKGESPRVNSADSYCVSDVQIGDFVTISYNRTNGEDICRTIRIVRRPGGVVPPAPRERPADFRRHHEQANADQQWEEYRQPYPRKYWPTYMGNDGKFYAGPYPTETRIVIPIRPVAPMPREKR